jgi:hypothetical protein
MVVLFLTLYHQVSRLSSIESRRFSFESLSSETASSFISQDPAACSEDSLVEVDMGMPITPLPILPVLPEVVIPSFSTFHLGLGFGQIAPAASVTLRHPQILSKVGRPALEKKSSNYLGPLASPAVGVVNESGMKNGMEWLADYSRWLDAKGGKRGEVTMIQRAPSPGSDCSSSSESSSLASPTLSHSPSPTSRPSNVPGMYSHLAMATSHSSSNAPVSVSTSSASTSGAAVEVEDFDDARARGSSRIPTSYASGVNTVEFPSIVSRTLSSSSGSKLGDANTTCEVVTNILEDVNMINIQEEEEEAVDVPALVEVSRTSFVVRSCQLKFLFSGTDEELGG